MPNRESTGIPPSAANQKTATPNRRVRKDGNGMKKLSRENFEKARQFILTRARPLEQALYRLRFETGPCEDVLAALAAYQNPDGGFGHALEPDLRMPYSSPIATTVALQIARRLKLPGDLPMIRSAVEYLVRSYDPGTARWPSVSHLANQFAHAPWWHYDETRAACMAESQANPSVEIIGYLNAYPQFVSRVFLENVTSQAVLLLERIPDPMNMHDFLCYQRFANELTGMRRQRVLERLSKAILETVCAEPNEWAGYVAQPLILIRSPKSPFAELLADALQLNLDYRIDVQNQDGSWSPFWSWFGSYPADWPLSEQEWKGKLTLDTLKILANFGRLEGQPGD